MSTPPRGNGERLLSPQNIFTGAMAIVGIMGAYSSFQRDTTGDIREIKARLAAHERELDRHERQIDGMRDVERREGRSE